MNAKTYLFFLLALSFFFLLLPQQARSAVQIVNQPVNGEEITLPTRAELEARLGRKLRFGERLVLGMAHRKVTRLRRKAARAGDGETSGLAITAFTMGALAVVLFVVGLFTLGPLLAGALLLGLLAVIFGGIAAGRIRKRGQRGKGWALAGLVSGLIVLLSFLGIVVAEDL